MKAIKENEVDLQGHKWAMISDEVKDLIRMGLSKDPNERPSCQQMLDHAWFKQQSPKQLAVKHKWIKSF